MPQSSFLTSGLPPLQGKMDRTKFRKMPGAGCWTVPLGRPRLSADIRVEVDGKSWLAGCYTHNRYWDSSLPECHETRMLPLRNSIG